MFCFVCKWLISNAMDADRPMSRFVNGHISRCSSCREFYEACLTIDQRLSDERPAQRVGVSADLEDRIYAALARKQRPIRIFPRRTVAAIAACLAIAAAVSVFNFLKPVQTEPTATARIESLAVSRFLSPQEWAVPDAQNDGLSGDWQELIEAPLSREISNLADDTRSAAGFLLASLPTPFTTLVSNLD